MRKLGSTIFGNGPIIVVKAGHQETEYTMSNVDGTLAGRVAMRGRLKKVACTSPVKLDTSPNAVRFEFWMVKRLRVPMNSDVWAATDVLREERVSAHGLMKYGAKDGRIFVLLSAPHEALAAKVKPGELHATPFQLHTLDVSVQGGLLRAAFCRSG